MTVSRALADLARNDSGRVLAILANRLGDVDLADDCVQEALLRAAQSWPDGGVPENPPAWLMTVARRIAIDRIRADRSAARRWQEAAPDLAAPPAAGVGESLGLVEHAGDAVRDDQLRLILLCCHPAINRDAQVALTLRLVGGLTTDEIAAAFLVPTPTVAQRITRAKRKIRDARIPLLIPADLTGRLGTVLSVLYLTYNEGYLARGASSEPLRLDLCAEAVRLMQVVAGLASDEAEPLGLLALAMFHEARKGSRVDGDHELVLLEDQDRDTWDATAIAEANRLVARFLRRNHPGPYQVQALIAATHVNAESYAATDWGRLAELYDQLHAMAPSPVVRLNAAAVRAMIDGPEVALVDLEGLGGLDTYHLFHATRGHLLALAGRPQQARVAWQRAAELAINPAERSLVARRLASLG